MEKRVNAVRKEDDIYYNTVFWIVAPTIRDILANKKDENGKPKWEMVGLKFEVNYEGEYLDPINKNDLTHKRIWAKEYANKYGQSDYTYYPRGRVNINKGVAYVNINSLMNCPHIIDAIIEASNIGKLELELDFNDTYQGSHYDFQLK